MQSNKKSGTRGCRRIKIGIIARESAYGHLEKLAFSEFFEIATSCNSLYYRELQHRIFKVTSKNCSF